ncbi:MAG: transcription-repair coupling factor [Candidatus Dactylopiibacterium carminicum]|uniref:Transcription-repair-coupling factor n=1 Tax=Candidatus Dactylopiibacterium carminicum TaxID=857335 RepID=A0A272EV97_9RHOO|nr:transcription-repair coupling factor [Candidatus Dactylopiibacterium carminicum]KAF7599684.1 transcription-repair coupling factor [Candidatus Dactylopiibacterium carminicum]PAS93590.1 MAG: transcription-repair coupling factor [Candidatus Dactylopiibacterium carminicum]PAS97469.1 MAG: transcription-repair coupling factor [Candidatus Dactylopiibacterium carminicum]PAS99686.1 MAG: transcription-repair coupling factor [Candidatus Dactylopiibacterium carminicum]
MTTAPLQPLSRINLPKPGQRLDLPRLHGASDAAALAQLAATGHKLVVITANPLDAQRLVEEIAWFAQGLRVHLLPDWETLPYDNFSPHQDLISERLATLYAIQKGESDITLLPASTALYRMAPPSYLAGHTFFMKAKERLDVEAFKLQMALAGYEHVTQVVRPGEFSVRGGLVDLFPMGVKLPYRIDLFDDEIDTIRTFDPDTQRTVYPVPEIRLLPAREFPLDDKARAHFRAAFREAFEGDPTKSPIYKDISNGVASAGIEYYLPLFFDETATLFDYLPKNAVLVTHQDVPGAIEAFWVEANSRYRLMAGDRARPLLPPDRLFLGADAFWSSAKALPRIAISASGDATKKAPLPSEGEGTASSPTSPLPDLSVERKATDPLHKLKHFLANFPWRVLLLAESAGRAQTITEYFAEYNLKPAGSADLAGFLASDARLALATGPLSAGFVQPSANIAILTENELYASQARPRGRGREGRKSTVEGWLKDLSELKIGDPVVHQSHGIGRYLGLVYMDMGEGDTEFLHLEYAEDTKLYVPVSQLHVITRYAGADPENIALHKLGSGQWEKAKRKAAQQVRDTAAELLVLYAKRAARPGHKFDFKQHDLEAFAEGFGFEETPDQLAAINAVVEDMRSGRPMDRLVCGDVGFGKTEVALRAAFIAVADGKQVAVLCPTTLLAEQHYQTFADRFADWPIKVAEISRFKTAKEQAEALEQLAQGKVDILIGTHRLLQKDVEFKRLGLVIIDEEHRFGVRQKEALKNLRAEVDILTLTATPIPRTLGMAMEGLREFSVIATAPQKRLAIKTFVQSWSKGIVREAVLREFKRGGQVYFLHNEVDTIDNMRESLAELLPEARIVVGHGQMNERELERVMRDFTTQRANLLLCTTIIETGINIPTANTIVINRADRFGLAQLHQLRGRVGRSHHQAYAYLLTDANAKPSANAQKRLEAISMMEDLGSGFFLAMHDLEIRGAGEVLGDNQSGEIQQVGFAMYSQMLNRAVRALQSGKEVDLAQPLDVTSEINLHSPALLPNAYCPDLQERLTLYKRMSNCEDLDELGLIQEELIDRFGELPDQARALLETHRLRIAAKPLGILKIDASDSRIHLHFEPNPPIEPIRIIKLIQNNRNWKLAGQDKLTINITADTFGERASKVRSALKQLTA